MAKLHRLNSPRCPGANTSSTYQFGKADADLQDDDENDKSLFYAFYGYFSRFTEKCVICTERFGTHFYTGCLLPHVMCYCCIIRCDECPMCKSPKTLMAKNVQPLLPSEFIFPV